MWSFWVMLLLRIASLAGAIAQTVGVVAFFTLDSLAPHRIGLIVGGTTVIAVSQLLIWWLAKKWAAGPGGSERDD